MNYFVSSSIFRHHTVWYVQSWYKPWYKIMFKTCLIMLFFYGLYAHYDYSGLLFDICCIELNVEQGKGSRLSVFTGNVGIYLPFSYSLSLKIQDCIFCVEILKATKTWSCHVHFINIFCIAVFCKRFFQETNHFTLNIFSMFELILIMDFHFLFIAWMH